MRVFSAVSRSVLDSVRFGHGGHGEHTQHHDEAIRIPRVFFIVLLL
jgi:hypothetical protein